MGYSIKQGSVMEGIFAMYCAAFLVDPEDGKSKTSIEGFINDLRIDTTLGALADKTKKSVDYSNTFPTKSGPAKKNFKDISIVTGQKAKGMIKGSEKYNSLSKLLKSGDKYFESISKKGFLDFSQVELKVRVKEAETGLYYGPNIKKLLDQEAKGESVADTKYKDIKKKMMQLINNNQTAFFRDLKGAKQKYLKNSQNDIVRWAVDADGIAGETSGGSIKQDVTIQIFADGKRILRSELNFSLKSDSASIHGGGLYNSMPEIFEMFEGIIPANRVSEGKKYLNSIINKRGHEETSKAAINSLWMLVGDGIPKTPNTKLSDHFWDILEKRLFGASNSYKGKIQLLEMNKNELSEITKKQFKKLRGSGILLFPKWIPNDNPEKATPGTIKIMPIYPGDGGKVKKTVEKDTNKEMYLIRISYEWTKQDVGGKKIRLQYGQAGAKSAPSKVIIELGRTHSIVHDENWDKFVDQGLVEG
tara:strand:- start:480 stop:1901 length:1422 start_codon:yes stop_codon:yes gene_type:complete